MNAREIWTLWIVNRKNTAEIARQLKLKECDVDSIISQCMNCHFSRVAMPFERVRT